MRTLFTGLICWGLLTSALTAEEWRQFRGPSGQGHAEAKNLPATWSEKDNVQWKTAVPGRAWSSPVFADGIIWLTTAVEVPAEKIAEKPAEEKSEKKDAKKPNPLASVTLRVVSIDAASGKLLSDTELLTVNDPPEIHSLNSYASPTPTLDGNLLLCHFGELGTVGFDTDAKKVLWKTLLPALLAVGAGSTPAVYNDLMIIPCDGTDQQYVVALNKLTGAEVWKTKRPKLTGEVQDYHKAYATPLLVKAAGRDQLVSPSAQWVVSYDPATGKELWRVRHGEGFSNAPCPVVVGDLVCVCTGFMKPELIAIRLDGEGDITDSHVAWKISKQVPTMPSPLVVEDAIYFINDQGVATCAKTSDGKMLWTKRISGNYCSSPLYADGKIYFNSQEGKTTVVRPGAKYDEVAVNTLEGQLMASPAVIGESLLLRTQSHLYRIGTKP
ncbi:MAG: PQQ-binding-like beta-propeller repeat protein [Planctomycetota bacterium]